MSAGEIASGFELTAATISHHLSALKKAEMVSETKVKNFVYYELNTTVFDDLLVWLAQFQSTAEREVTSIANRESY